MAVKLTLLFDGACPLCQREVNFLRYRDKLNNICFVDIDSPNYQPKKFADISYREAMGRIHAITSSGRILKDVSVFREAYRLVGLGWIYAPTTWPILSPFIDHIYKIWASWRLPLTRRGPLEKICKDKDLCRKS